MKLLENKVVVITGAARGIGASIAAKLADQGANIAISYLTDSSKEKAELLVHSIEKLGVKARAWQTDASDFAQSEKFVNDIIDTFGTIDICVNNAGISIDNLLLRMSEDQWDKVIRTNLKSVFNMTKHVIKPMLRAKQGSIINMSSVIGIMGNAGQASYAASKAGIIGLTKSTAHELAGRQIRCNAIAPGFIETDMTQYLKEGKGAEDYIKRIPLGRYGKVEDIANAALFLASDMSSYITGQVISVCGGLNI